MKTDKIEKIKNSDGNEIHLHMNIGDDLFDKTIFIQHGLAGSVNDDLYVNVGDVYNNSGWNYIKIDSTNSLNHADGDISKFTIDRHVKDMEEAISWAVSNGFANSGKFGIFGHSMGGYSAIRNAIKFNEHINHVISSSPVITGKRLYDRMKISPDYDFEKWKKSGLDISNPLDGELAYGNIPFFAWDEWLSHDISDYIHDLKIPLYLIVGELDLLTTAEDSLWASNMIPDMSKLSIVPKSTHCYEENMDGYINNIKQYISEY